MAAPEGDLTLLHVIDQHFVDDAVAAGLGTEEEIRNRLRDQAETNFTGMLDGVETPVRPNMGIYTQPISFIGLPVAAVPIPLTPLPIGVQIIAAPWREDVPLRIAHALEAADIVTAAIPALEESRNKPRKWRSDVAAQRHK